MKFVLYLVPWDKPIFRFLKWAHNGIFIVFSISLFYTFEGMKVRSTEMVSLEFTVMFWLKL